MTTQQRLARLQQLKDAWWAQAHSVLTEDSGYRAGLLSEIRAEIRAQQFQLLLHTPCCLINRYLPRFWS